MSIDDKSMLIALVTRIDEKYIYIWSTSMGINELRYPFKSIIGLEVCCKKYYCYLILNV